MTIASVRYPAFILAAVAAAISLRLWDVADRPFWLDESWSRWLSGKPWPQMFQDVRLYDTHPPFYYSLLKLWRSLGFESAAGLRMLSVLAGLAMLPLAWFCARTPGLLSRWSTAFVVAGVAVSPVLIHASRQARPYALFALAAAFCLFFALRLLTGASGGRARFLAWLGYLISFEMMLWLHNVGILFGAAFGGGLFLALWVNGRLRSSLPAFLGVHLLAGLAWLPALLVMIEKRNDWADGWLRIGWSEVPSGIVTGIASPAIVGPLLLLLGGWGFLQKFRRNIGRDQAILLLCAAIVPAILAILISAISTPIFLPRTLVPSALPLLILAAAGLEQLPGRLARIGTGAVTLLLLMFVWMALVSRPADERWGEVAVWLQERVGQHEEVWLLPNELILPLRDSGWPGSRISTRGIPADFPAPSHPSPRRSGTLAVPSLEPDEASRLVADARRRGVTGIWVVSLAAPLFDPEDAMSRALAGDGRASVERSFGRVMVKKHRLVRTPSPLTE